MYKLVAIDLDGTLLNQYGEITENTKNVIKKITSMGVMVVIASGRISDSVITIAKEIGADKYYVSGNGSTVFDMQKNQIIYENFLNKEKMLELVNLCDRNSIYYNIYTETAVIAKSINYNVAFYNYENNNKIGSKKTDINIVENVAEYIKNSNINKFLKMTICDESKAIFSSIVRKLKMIEGIEVLDVSHMSRKTIKEGTKEVDVGYFYTEVSSPNVTKWNALKKILEIEHISPEEVIAMGDNINDISMIEKAGIGVAMGQSNPKVKEIATMITDDNTKEGVANALVKIFDLEE